MLRITSPQIATRSESRKKITSPRRVAGGVDDAEAGDLVALVEEPVDLARRPRPEPGVDASPAARSARGPDRAPALHRVDVVGMAGQGDAARLADRLGAPLVVGVDMGQGEHRDLPALELG